MAGVVVFALVVVGYTAISRRAASANLSAAIVFMAVGAVLGISHLPTGIDPSLILHLAEATLAMILFHDAAQVRPRQLIDDKGALLRLLLIGLPITIGLGWLVIAGLLPQIGVWWALFIAAALAPTDAGLGAATVLNPVVPARIRRLLNGESGLNDGLATPVVLFALAAAANPPQGSDVWHALVAAVIEIAIGAVLGAVIGFGGGWVLRRAAERGWAQSALLPLAVATLPFLAYFGATLAHGNGFIAAFIAGTAYARSLAAAEDGEHDLEMTEQVSSVLAYLVWGLFGLLVVSRIFELVTWQSVLFAVLALTVLRMVPVWAVLLGTGFRLPTSAFIGWFGPRGLASVVFALIAVEGFGELSGTETLLSGVIGVTVLLSVVAHGITAGPWAAAYGRWVARKQPAAETAGS